MPYRAHVGSTSASMARTRIEQRRLRGHEALQAPIPTDPLRLDNRRGGVRGAADVADLALVHEVGQRAERLLDVCARIRTVDLVEVDPIRTQPPKRVLHCPRDPAARIPHAP